MAPKIYTKSGDDGTTGLLYGGRVRKDSWRIELNGVVDEAQAAIGMARAETAPGSEARPAAPASRRFSSRTSDTRLPGVLIARWPSGVSSGTTKPC